MKTGEVIPFSRREFTLNMNSGGEFFCMACGHWVVYTNETEWGDFYVRGPKQFGHMHGTEPFHFCPNCGAAILTTQEWAEMYPQDQGKTTSEIEKRFY